MFILGLKIHSVIGLCLILVSLALGTKVDTEQSYGDIDINGDRPPFVLGRILRMRRSAEKFNDIENMFIGWGKLVSTMSLKHRIEVRSLIETLVLDAELESLDDNQLKAKSNEIQNNIRYNLPEDEYLDFLKKRLAKVNDIHGMEHLFLSWAKSISKFDPKTQVELKTRIGKFIKNLEMDEYYEKNLNEVMKLELTTIPNNNTTESITTIKSTTE